MLRFFFPVLVLLLGSLACAPQAAPPPSTPPPAQTPAVPKATLLPAFSQEETSLQNLVEAAKKEGSLTIYGFYQVGDVGLAMQRAFKERYGINVDIITGRGAEFLERLRTEARTGNITGDLTEGAATHIFNMKEAGLTVSIKEQLPVLQEKDVWRLDPTFLDSAGHLLVVFPYFMPPFINTKLVKPEDEPKSWYDLLQPKWKGNILCNDPVISSGPYLVFQALVRAGALPEDYLAKLGDQNIVFVTGGPQGMEWLARGQAWLHVGVDMVVGADAILRGAPIKAVDLKEGISGQGAVQAVIKNAPHPNAARLFANWWLSKEGQLVYSKAKGSLSVRKDVPSAMPPGADINPVKPIFVTSEDSTIQGKMFRDRVWVPLLKKGK